MTILNNCNPHCLSMHAHIANSRSADRSIFGEGREIAYYDNVTCGGTESRLIDCQSLQFTSHGINCGYAGVFCQSK